MPGALPQRIPPSAVLLRLLVGLGPVAAVLATAPAGAGPPWWVVAGVGALAAAAAVAPDSQLPAGATLAALAWWAATLGDGLTPWLMVAAVALLVGHLAALVAGYGPLTLPADPATVALWTRRGALVAVTVPATWALARALAGTADVPGTWLLGVAATLAATVLASVALGRRSP